ncbi:Rhodanese-related sulfurtransferase [hydrothermal vent metagenome]|uniref:Rhodanese-related sulfurtransferase n=1 Tax=hydrothermal vent metagenome TaxID=652676 RepID=A0A3B0WRQ3_9ZZZZ
MKTFKEIVAEASKTITELMPWDVDERIKENEKLIIVDIREECEFMRFHIRGSMLVPRGILESACEDEYEDAVPDLVTGRDKEIVIICRSGLRSALGVQMLQMMGFSNISSMKTGLRGWNDYELPLYDLEQNELNPDDVDEMLSAGFCSTFMHPDRRTIKA